MSEVVRVGGRCEVAEGYEVYRKVFNALESTQSCAWKPRKTKVANVILPNEKTALDLVTRIAKKDYDEFRDLQKLLGNIVKKYIKPTSVQHYIAWKTIKEQIERIDRKPCKTARDIQKKNILYQLLVSLVVKYLLDVLRRGRDPQLKLPEAIRVAKRLRKPKKFVVGLVIDRRYDPLKVPRFLKTVRARLERMGLDFKKMTVVTFTGQWINFVKKYFEDSEVIEYSSVHISPKVNYLKAADIFVAYLAIHGGLLFVTDCYKSLRIAADKFGVPMYIVDGDSIREFIPPYGLLRYFCPRRVYGERAQKILQDLQKIYEIGRRIASITGYTPTFLSVLEATGLRNMVSKGKTLIQVYPFEPVCLGDTKSIEYPFSNDIVGITDENGKRIIRIELWSGTGGEEFLGSIEYGEANGVFS